MNDIYELDLPAHVAEMLLWMVDHVAEQKVLTVSYQSISSFQGIGYDLIAGQASVQFTKLPEDVIVALGLLLLIQSHGDNESGVLMLTAKAHEWASHHQRSKMGQRWERLTHWGKQAAPLIVSIAAVILTILQILQALGVL